MYSWKALRALLVRALEVLAMAAGPPPVVQAQQAMAAQVTQGVLERLAQARTVRQVQELQSLAALWPLELG